MNEELKDLIWNLRFNCAWQRLNYGNYWKTEFPYHKHLPHCSICQAAEELTRFYNENAASDRGAEEHSSALPPAPEDNRK